MESLEEVIYEAHRMKGWNWVHEEPLWCTWTLEKFGMFSNYAASNAPKTTCSYFHGESSSTISSISTSSG